MNSIIIAKYIIAKCEENGYDWNKTKIQKLLYACHGVHLAALDRPLLDKEMVIMPFGPVDLRVLEAMQDDITLQSYSGNISDIPIEMCNIIDNALQSFGKWNAGGLAEWSHEDGSPWAMVKSKSDKWSKDIPNALIQEYFSKNVLENNESVG